MNLAKSEMQITTFVAALVVITGCATRDAICHSHHLPN
jgi:hypothetical protein